MKKKEMPALPPYRKELSDTPNRLCNQISRLFHSKMREGNTTDDGVMSQPGAKHVLGVLAAGDGITQLDIVKRTNLRPPTVSVILRKMEEKGIVTRKQDAEDMRQMRVYLTDYGHELDGEIIARIKEIDSIALAGLDGEEIDTLMRLLGKIRNNLQADAYPEKGVSCQSKEEEDNK